MPVSMFHSPPGGDAHASAVREPALDPDDRPLELEELRNVVGFAFRAIFRRRRLALAVFSVIAAGTLVAAVLLPRQYQAETKIMAQRNLVMPALGNPRRSVPTDSDAPTLLAREAILKRENLVAIIKQTNLTDRWESSRPLVLRVKDTLLRPFRGELTTEDKIEALVGLLDKRLGVGTAEGTVAIGVEWPDAELAYLIVETAQHNFLEERHAREVSIIAEAISILETHASGVRETIETTLEEIRAARPGKVVRTAAPAVPRPRKEDGEVMQLRTMLLAKRSLMTDLETFRNKRLAELYAALAEQKNTYGPEHPAIANTLHNIRALSEDSPQLTALKREEQDLLAELTKRGVEDIPKASTDMPRVVLAPAPPLPEPKPDEDENVTYARSRLKIAVSKYEDLLERMDAARIELDTARAAFKYRYGILAPARIPKKPSRPRMPLLLGGGLMAALAAAAAVAVLADALSGRMLETWQVERTLRLPVLGEVQRV
jgi:hypothetical protein